MNFELSNGKLKKCLYFAITRIWSDNVSLILSSKFWLGYCSSVVGLVDQEMHGYNDKFARGQWRPLTWWFGDKIILLISKKLIT